MYSQRCLAVKAEAAQVLETPRKVHSEEQPRMVGNWVLQGVVFLLRLVEACISEVEHSNRGEY